jgi:hypothetical protein
VKRDFQTKATAKAAARCLQLGRRNVVYCKFCQSARLDGPEHCPKCGGLLVDARTLKPPVPEKEKIVEHIEEKAIVETNGVEGRGWRCQVTFKGQTFSLNAWAMKLGVDGIRLGELVHSGVDLTPYVKGAPLPSRKDVPPGRRLPGPPSSGPGRGSTVVTGEMPLCRRCFKPALAGRTCCAEHVEETKATLKAAYATPVQDEPMIVTLRAQLAKLDALDVQIKALGDQRVALLTEIKGMLRG